MGIYVLSIARLSTPSNPYNFLKAKSSTAHFSHFPRIRHNAKKLQFNAKHYALANMTVTFSTIV